MKQNHGKQGEENVGKIKAFSKNKSTSRRTWRSTSYLGESSPAEEDA